MADSTKKAFVYNEQDNRERSTKKDKLIELCKIVRSNCTNIEKCILYKSDNDAKVILTLPPSQEMEYAVLTMFDRNNDPKKFELSIKLNQGILTAHKYKVVASKKLTKEYPVCKMVIKL